MQRFVIPQNILLDRSTKAKLTFLSGYWSLGLGATIRRALSECYQSAIVAAADSQFRQARHAAAPASCRR